jgi:peptide/nickel transport system ATP-binding protein
MLSVQNLNVTFTMYDVGLTQKQLTAIADLDLEVNAGEVVAVVGSSGSGKSLLAHAIIGILPHNAQVSGRILFKGSPLTSQRQATVRGKEIALIPQSVSYLDPLMRVGTQVHRAAQLSGLSAADARKAVDQVFSRYELDSQVKHCYPFQISGGMARRVLVATAAIGRADLVIADEPTSSLNPELIVETLNHLRELATSGKGIILITHNLEAALQIADKVAVFYAGTTLEIAAPRNFTQGNLYHPYTYALWRSLPQNDFIPVPGTQPSPDALPTGCLFSDRCELATDDCLIARPPLRQIQNALVRCIHAKG